MGGDFGVCEIWSLSSSGCQMHVQMGEFCSSGWCFQGRQRSHGKQTWCAKKAHGPDKAKHESSHALDKSGVILGVPCLDDFCSY